MAPAASACCRTKALGFHVMTMAGTLSPCTRRHCRSATPSIPGSSPHGRAGEIGVWPPGGWPVRRWSRAFPRAASASPPRKGRLPSRQSAPQRLSRMAIKAGYIGGYTEEYSFKKSTLFQLDSGNCDSVSGHHFSLHGISQTVRQSLEKPRHCCFWVPEAKNPHHHRVVVQHRPKKSAGGRDG